MSWWKFWDRREFELSDKPSEAIAQALADFEWVEKSRKFKVDMDVWYEPNGVCSVCLGGSVLARHHQKKTNKYAEAIKPCVITPHNLSGIPYDERGKIKCMNYVRRGKWDHFAYHWPAYKYQLADLDKCELPEITPYEEDPDQFKLDVRKAIAHFQAEGL